MCDVLIKATDDDDDDGGDCPVRASPVSRHNYRSITWPRHAPHTVEPQWTKL